MLHLRILLWRLNINYVSVVDKTDKALLSRNLQSRGRAGNCRVLWRHREEHVAQTATEKVTTKC